MNKINHILDENEKLIADLNIQLDDAKKVIEAIKDGNIDALLLVNNKTTKVLVSNTADISYRKFIQQMSEGVLTIDIEGTILYANNSFSKIVGLHLEKVTSSNLKDFISPIYLRKFETLLNDSTAEQSRIELSMVNHDHVVGFYIVTLNRITLKELVTLNLVLTDISDLKKTEESMAGIIKQLNLAIDKQRVSEEALHKINAELKEHINALEYAKLKLSNLKK